MFAPGSDRLVGWSISRGLTGLQNRVPSPDGGMALELGPRNVAGRISQTVRTAAGRSYKLTFSACTGRAVFHFNRQARIKVANIDEVFDCPVGPIYKLLSYEFKVNSPLTTVSFACEGNAGFGPFIDGVSLSKKSE